eukprot:6131976-Amphidinium_carterae.1
MDAKGHSGSHTGVVSPLSCLRQCPLPRKSSQTKEELDAQKVSRHWATSGGEQPQGYDCPSA